MTSLEKYDIIMLHTSSRTTIIAPELFATVKPTAILHTFIGSHTMGEIAGEVYTDKVQLIADR